MPAHTLTHVHHGPPPLTADELTALRWEDDGGPLHEVTPNRSAQHWLRISGELGVRLKELAGRDDVIVTCTPGTRSGAPAAFYPTVARLEVDAELFAPLSPVFIRPARPGDEERYPIAWGAFVHEAAHAAHTHWNIPTPVHGTALGEAAEMLEEARAEGAQVRARPQDRRYLRACTLGVIFPGFTTLGSDRSSAAMAAGLLLARRDAGILHAEETAPLDAAVRTLLGETVFGELESIWQAVQHCADDDEAGMLVHADAWCNALNTDPESPPPPPTGTGEEDGSSSVAQAVAQAMEAIAAEEDLQSRADTSRRERKEARAARAEQDRRAEVLTKAVFNPTGRPHQPRRRKGEQRADSPVTRKRQPSGAERAAAGRLARALKAAAYRERTTTVTHSAMPPGRLNMRQALAREAQQAAGATPTATPFTRTERRPTPMPPLRVGIAVDVSGSMSQATAPMASAAWIMARAVALTDPDSMSATIAYDRALTALNAPGKPPAQVTEFEASGMGHSLGHAIEALNTALTLDRPGTGRLLVISSDGYYAPSEALHAYQRITELRAAGCAVLWLAFEPDARPLPGATFLELTDPAQAAPAIAAAATTALATT
ncbi:hypothetical protein [Streptomyces sp. NPDC050738]|uniref:hypothetical protein n=1 Tax=Streptomyces sp. NPDC050738 TaxID=3154744 RepID=UPI00342B73D7